MEFILKNNVRFLIVAVILITTFSCCSFVFETNPWVDTNIMFTCGRSMLDEIIIYADIIDHKGPVLYFIYMLAALISSTSYFGIYLIEIMCLTIFLYYSNKISCLVFEKDLNMVMVFTLGILTVSSQVFKFGCSSAEEFMLPIM